MLVGCAIRDGAVVVDAAQETTVPGVYCAGELTGIGGAELALCEGGTAATSALGKTERRDYLAAHRDGQRRFAAALNRAFALREELRTLADGDTLICRCEDVPHKLLASYQSWRAAKLQTRCGMGPCQGRVCGAAAQFVFGWTSDSVRPPIFPARVETLASMPWKEGD